jgi:hypothetical protein
MLSPISARRAHTATQSIPGIVSQRITERNCQFGPLARKTS